MDLNNHSEDAAPRPAPRSYHTGSNMFLFTSLCDPGKGFTPFQSHKLPDDLCRGCEICTQLKRSVKKEFLQNASAAFEKDAAIRTRAEKDRLYAKRKWNATGHEISS